MNKDPEYWTKYLVEVNGQYVRNQPLHKMYASDWKPLYTQHIWDAKPYRTQSLARRFAEKLGGNIRVFDKLEGGLIG